VPRAENARDKTNCEWQESQNERNRTRQLHIAVFAAIAGLIGVVLGKYLASTPLPIIIQQPTEPRPEPK